MGTKCFIVTRLPRARIWLRRFASNAAAREVPGAKCSINGYHDALVFLADVPDLNICGREPTAEEKLNPKWPSKCDCGYQFTDQDEWQIFNWNLCADAGGKIYVMRSRDRSFPDGYPPGAMHWETWLHEDGRKCAFWDNCDGRHLIVTCPNGREWDVDSRASNCTMPNDRTHRCWIRHGEVPNITVDKSGGATCAAGAGSILAGSYHGFLRNGELT